MSFTWEGRQLRTAAVNGKGISYTYNSDGIRTGKTVDGVTTEYFVDGSSVLAQKTGNDILWFLYDSDGTRVGFTYNDTAYYYTKNAQGDVTGIVDTSANTVVEYSYDAWGKLLTTTGNMADTIGKLNPFLYRGYYFDAETELFYLNNRYYDSSTSRFLNADGVAGADQDLLSYNLFAYCGNDPINRCDPLGTTWIYNGVAYNYSGTVADFHRLEQGLSPLAYEAAVRAGAKGKSLSGSIDTKSPPPPNTGYKPPKNPDKGKKRVPAPGGRGETGWLDKSGNVWVPDVDMDGGEGWRRHYRDGSHDHVYPGGKVRTHTFTWDPTLSEPVIQEPSFTEQIAAATGLTGTALIIYIVISEGSRVIPARNLIPVP
ncbi:MAG: RHS repeat-associated core domain-containing protein [Ruminococcaceae bacterium]|nr:RHS repeat-associated core domain-containing protein [Oscillospiraceae bacterium]